MILALATGWTPDVIAELPARFAAACRWVLYARAIVGDRGLPAAEIPQGAPPAVLREALLFRQQVERIRAVLYPEDD